MAGFEVTIEERALPETCPVLGSGVEKIGEITLRSINWTSDVQRGFLSNFDVRLNQEVNFA